MSSHHGHHRSSHHSRSNRMHHSNSHYQSNLRRSHSRTSTSNKLNISNSSGGGGGGGGGTSSSGNNRPTTQQQQHQQTPQLNSDNNISRCDLANSDWSEHRSSSGKVYYYNTRSGVSQWEIPAELKQQQQQQQRPTSPDSEISESSSIRQQQDNSPSSSASSHKSSLSDSLPEDKPLLTPSLSQYFKPELIVKFNSSQLEEYEKQANQYASDALILSEKILKCSTDLKIAKAVVHYCEISLEAQDRNWTVLKETINKIKST